MGLFGNKQPKPFVSNGRLVEILSSSNGVQEGISGNGTEVIEKLIERRYLYRNVESVSPAGSSDVIIIKYKDLKVRSEMEVKMMREKMRKDAGLDIER